MTPALSSNTQAILLLTAPLIAGRSSATPDLLSPGEYKRLAQRLREIEREPADLLASDAIAIIEACRTVVDADRLGRLLERGFLLSQAVERWQTRAIWVVSRADAEYPRRLKMRLRGDAPAVLYGCGDMRLLDNGGLAVVGSRHVDEALVEHSMSIGHLAARAGRAIVSGGAKGIDQAAMRGALEAGGQVAGVLADSLEKQAMQREHRNMLLDGQLTLVSPYDPGAGFNVGNAMQRNKLIYALADAALVVSSDVNKGGTWSGAVEQLDKFRCIPVYVRSTGEPSPGLDALHAKGALAWPNPDGVDAFEDILATPLTEPSQAGLSFAQEMPERASRSAPPPERAAPGEAVADLADEALVRSPTGNLALSETPAEIVFAAVRKSVEQLLSVPMKDSEVAEALDISTAQARLWLSRLVDEGLLEKRRKPVVYVVKAAELFG